MRYLIIGNSAAGIFAAEAIRQGDKTGAIDILSSETYPAYARCLTSYFLAGGMKESDLFLREADFYRQHGLTLHCGERVVRVTPDKKEVQCDSCRHFHYDKLLIASGSSPQIPDIPGVDSRGVFGLRTLADAKNILAMAGPGKRVVVVGGGFVSLKAAYALLKSGHDVTCLITSGQVLSQMLDGEAAGILADVLTEHGLKIRYHSDVREILAAPDESGGRIRALRLESGEELPADLLIIGKGVTPNTDFLKDSAIALDHGVLVDEYLAANIPNIFAAGDVAQGYDLISGTRRINALWPNATEQGRLAGRNMAGENHIYSGSMAMNSADFFGLSVIAAGWTRGGESDGCQVVQLRPAAKVYRRLVFRGDRLVGFILVGDTWKAGLLTALIREGTPLGHGRESLARGIFQEKALW